MICNINANLFYIPTCAISQQSGGNEINLKIETQGNINYIEIVKIDGTVINETNFNINNSILTYTLPASFYSASGILKLKIVGDTISNYMIFNCIDLENKNLSLTFKNNEFYIREAESKITIESVKEEVNILDTDLKNTVQKTNKNTDDIEDLINAIENLSMGWENIDNKPTTYPPSLHTHNEYADKEHNHVWDSISDKPTTFTPTVHTHSEYALKEHTHTQYADSTHTHNNATLDNNGFLSKEDKSKINNYETDIEKLKKDVSNLSGGSINVDWDDIENKPISYTPAEHTHQNATHIADGFMSSDDKAKLNGIEIGATKNVGENNLTSTSTTNFLSAYQGKVLNDKIKIVSDNNTNIENKVNSIMNDTGWINCTLASGFENYADDQVLKVRRIGDLVEIRGAVKTTKSITGSSNMNAIITMLDDVFIPSQRVVTSSVGTSLNMQMFTIYPNGNVTLVRYINMKDGSYTTVTNAMWIQIQGIWYVE